MSAMRSQTLRISPAGLRGVVGKGLTAAQVLDFGAAFGTFLPVGKPVILGRDPRASSRMLREGVAAALVSCGHQVIDLGVVSTPVIQHAISMHDASGGVSIGASHNNAEWNALKFFGPQGTYLTTAEANELLDIYHLHKFSFADWEHIGSLTEDETALEKYLDDLAAVYDFEKLRTLRVVADCCNGTSSIILRRLNERFQMQFVLINEAVRGQAFAHDPIISTATMSLQLAPLVKPLQAVAGFAFDVDSDRVGLVTAEGVPVSEEMLVPLLADFQLPRSTGKLVITNLSTTALTEEVAKRHGGKVVRVAVGRQAAIDGLSIYRAEQIALAGEGSGAVMLPQFRFVYDGIACMLAVLTMMQDRGQSLSEMLAGYPEYVLLKGEVPLRSSRIPALLSSLQEKYSDGTPNTADGLRIDWPDRWFHVRVSQTEPIVRVICEQRGEKPSGLFNDLVEQVRQFA